jgi:hypothetical protein
MITPQEFEDFCALLNQRMVLSKQEAWWVRSVLQRLQELMPKTTKESPSEQSHPSIE